VKFKSIQCNKKVVCKFFQSWWCTQNYLQSPIITKILKLVSIFTILVFIILIGAVYYALFYSSKWQASIGKRIFNIKIVDKNNHRKVKFFDGFCYYFLTIIPYFFILILFIYISKNNISIYQVFKEIWGFTFFGIAILFAVNMSSFNKKKINFFDYLMDFEFHIGKTKSKYPW